MMETHYNNPLNGADSIKSTNRQKADNSGLKLYYTNNLRKHDAGVLSIGMLEKVSNVLSLKTILDDFAIRMTRVSCSRI